MRKTDLKEIMLEIEAGLFEVHAEARKKKEEEKRLKAETKPDPAASVDTTPSNNSTQPQEPKSLGKIFSSMGLRCEPSQLFVPIGISEGLEEFSSLPPFAVVNSVAPGSPSDKVCPLCGSYFNLSQMWFRVG